MKDSGPFLALHFGHYMKDSGPFLAIKTLRS